MRIIYLHQYFKTNNDNGGTRSYEFAKDLVKKGHEVIMITGEASQQEYIDGIKIISTKTKYNQKMNKLQRIKSFFDYILKSTCISLKIKDIDLVFATSTPLTIGIPAVLIKKIKKCKMIFEVRDVWPDIPYELGLIKNKIIIGGLKKLEKICYKNSNHIIVLSDGMRSNIIGKGINENKVTTITNIANKPLYDFEINKNIVKERFGLKDKFICIHPGTMGMVNGLEFILRVAEETRDRDIVYLLIGEGNEKENLKTIKDEKSLDNVIFMDSLPKKDIIEIIKASDIGIMCVANYPILKDNSANKFFDFLASELPIIINYEGWQANVLKENECGFNYRYNDHKSMAIKIENLKSDDKHMNSLKNNSKRTSEAYSLDNCLNKLNNVINKCEGI